MYRENDLKEDYDLNKESDLMYLFHNYCRIICSFSLVLSKTCFNCTKLDSSYFTKVGFNIPISPQVETKLKAAKSS